MNKNNFRRDLCKKSFVSFLCNLLVVGNIVPLYPTRAHSQGVTPAQTQKSDSPAFGWVRGKRANANDTVSFRIFLDLPNEDELTHLVDKVSDPKSSSYGQYKSMDEIRDLVKPSESAHEEVKQWLRSSGVAEEACTKDWDSYTCEKIPAPFVERLLNVKVNAYQHEALKNRMVFMTEEHMTMPPSAHFVSGVELYDPTVKARHSTNHSSEDTTSVEPPFARRAFEEQSGSGSGSTPASGDPLIMDFFNSHALGENWVTLALNCADGSLTNINEFPVNWCAEMLDAPSSVTVFLSQAGTQIKSKVFDLPPTSNSNDHCSAMSSEWKIYKNSTIKNLVTCSLYTNFPLDLWQRYEITAQVKFTSGATSNVVKYRNIVGTGPTGTIRLINNKRIKPSLIQSQYDLPTSAATGTSQVVQGILELTNAEHPRKGFLRSDLETFMTNNNIAYNQSLLSFVGAHNSVFQGETSLDLELIMSINPGTPTVLWNSLYDSGSTARNIAEALLAWAQSISSTSSPIASNPPSIWSISYGLPENSQGEGTTPHIMNRINSHFKMLSASGVSIFASSGDSGTGGSHNSGIAVPLFPASSPYVTAVGATALITSSDGGDPYEIVCSARDSNLITSGGGFSSNFPQPSYQKEAVSKYLDAGPYISPSIQTGNRAYPDIAAFGASIYTIQNGKEATMFGTSASSPLVASIFARINQARLNAGKPMMGAVNPFLYQTAVDQPDVFTDVTQGNNCAGEMSNDLPPAAFPSSPLDKCYVAAAGWDPVTGFGSINYPALKQAAMAWVPSTQTPTPSFVPTLTRSPTLEAKPTVTSAFSPTLTHSTTLKPEATVTSTFSPTVTDSVVGATPTDSSRSMLPTIIGASLGGLAAIGLTAIGIYKYAYGTRSVASLKATGQDHGQELEEGMLPK